MVDEKRLEDNGTSASHAISYTMPTMEEATPQHHGAGPNAQRDIEEDITYTKDVHSEKRELPESGSLDSSGQKKDDKDEEAGESVPSRSWRRYRPWLKHVVYAVIWLLFTG